MVTKIIAHQIENGFGFDLSSAQDLEQRLMYEKASVEDSMRGIFPDKVHVRISEKTGKRLKDKIEVFNPGSRQQIGDRLNSKYGWSPPLTDKGNYNIDATVLKSLEFPEAKELCVYFDTTKLISQVSDWVTRASHSRDGRIHGSLNPQGTVTGRMTASQPNLQQVSSDPRARALFIPRDGWVEVGVDASGLEARLLASRMAEFDSGAYADVVLNGDIHTTNQEAAGLECRDQAKTFFYGFIYGAGNKKIGEIVGRGESVGARLKKTFLKGLPALKKVMDRARVSADTRKAVTLLDGRSVPVRSAHKALNTQLQGDGAIVMKLAQCILNEKIKQHGLTDKAKFMATVHDEWQLECMPDCADQVGQLGVTSIIEAGERLKCRMPMDGEYKIGKNWSECH
jgi:DNA polymerase I-like protein with 3'-5' exonuclease and polymerase domains